MENIGKVYDCNILEAACKHRDDARIINTEIFKTDETKTIDINSGIKLPADEETAAVTRTPLEMIKTHDSWYFLNGKFYYLKDRLNNFAILNELIGEELAEYMGIPTVHYALASNEGNIIGILSENFLDGTYTHQQGLFASRKILREMRKMLTDKNFECDESLRRKYTAMLIKHFYSSLADRNANTYYGICNGKLVFTPTFDYESSFINPFGETYIDPLINYSFNPESSEFIKENNEYFEEYLEMIKNCNIINILSKVEENHGIRIPNDFVDHYVSFEKNKKEFMKTLGL